MKIGIITFWWSEDNYGQLLQCYALQKYLRDLGHKPFLIRYKCTEDIIADNFYTKLSLKHIYSYFRNKLYSAKAPKKNNRLFDDFRSKYINSSEKIYKSFNELKNEDFEVDMLIVGSDQIWNNWNNPLYRFSNRIHACFLDFGRPEVKRLSYAASWGLTKLSDDYIKEITPLLSKFNYVSVREKNGIDLCKLCGCPDAEWVCDPTLLLTAADYRELYKNEKINNYEKKYILLYMLNNDCNFSYQAVHNLASQKKLEIIYVTGNGLIDHHPKFDASIPEWLYYLDNAEYVITNSFHCGVFSTIFHKQFGIIPLNGKSTQSNSRIDSLFELRGTGNRYIIDNDFSILDEPYSVNEIEISKRFNSFL